MDDKQPLFHQKDLVDRYLRATPRNLSVFAFVHLFTWQDHFQFDFRVIEQRLCVFARHEAGTFLYWPPLGPGFDKRVAAQCFAIMREANHGKGVGRIENIQLSQSADFDTAKFAIYRKGHEYCYFREDLVALQGNALKSKRHAYNQFVKNHQSEFLPYAKSMAGECLALFDAWVRQKERSSPDAVARQMLEENRRVHQLVLEFYDRLDLIGRVVTVNGRIAGYTFGYALNEQAFCVFLETTDLTVDGLAVFIFHEFCRDGAQSFPIINVMDDFALQNVEQTKLSFRPCSFVPAYTVSERQ